MANAPSGSPPRRLSWPKVLLLILAFLTVPEIVSLYVLGAEAQVEEFDTTLGLTAKVMLEGGKVVLVALVVWRLRWWSRVWHEPLRTRRWTWGVPVVLFAASLAAVHWNRLAAVSAGMLALFAVSVLLVGLGEELLFRGVVLCAMRDKHRELAAALLSTALFGLMHLVNLLTLGGGALGEVVVAFLAGFAYYVCRRVSGGLLLPVVLHAVYDFSAFSGWLGPGAPEELAGPQTLQVVLTAVIGVVVLVGFRWLAPGRPSREASHRTAGEAS